VNEFYNHDWSDTASLYVDDDDYQVVFNNNYELKIADKFYKYLANNIVAIIGNSNVAALEQARMHGFFPYNQDITFYNEEDGVYENPTKPSIQQQTQSCSDFTLLNFVSKLTPLSSTANQWDVELTTLVFYFRNATQIQDDYTYVKANYTIDWGD